MPRYFNISESSLLRTLDRKALSDRRKMAISECVCFPFLKKITYNWKKYECVDRIYQVLLRYFWTV